MPRWRTAQPGRLVLLHALATACASLVVLGCGTDRRWSGHEGLRVPGIATPGVGRVVFLVDEGRAVPVQEARREGYWWHRVYVADLPPTPGGARKQWCVPRLREGSRSGSLSWQTRAPIYSHGGLAALVVHGPSFGDTDDWFLLVMPGNKDEALALDADPACGMSWHPWAPLLLYADPRGHVRVFHARTRKFQPLHQPEGRDVGPSSPRTPPAWLPDGTGVLFTNRQEHAEVLRLVDGAAAAARRAPPSACYGDAVSAPATATPASSRGGASEAEQHAQDWRVERRGEALWYVDGVSGQCSLVFGRKGHRVVTCSVWRSRGPDTQVSFRTGEDP